MGKIAENPVKSVIIGAGAVATALLAISAFTGKMDTWVVSEPELDARFVSEFSKHELRPHRVAEDRIDQAEKRQEEIRRESRCQAVDIQISIVEGQIWQMESSGESSQRLVEKRRELTNLKDKRTSLQCSEFS